MSVQGLIRSFGDVRGLCDLDGMALLSHFLSAALYQVFIIGRCLPSLELWRGRRFRSPCLAVGVSSGSLAIRI
jgi:hypothetical protein